MSPAQTPAQRHEGCGGSIHRGYTGRHGEHIYCLRCQAYTTDLDGPFPSGTDQLDNEAAWFRTDAKSPEAQ